MQLKLFSGKVSRSLQVGTRKKTPKTVTPQQVGWDLWSQDTGADQEMALLFLDIRNFTTITESHVASDIVHLVRKLFMQFQHIIRMNHGRIIETTGDGFYAAFGDGRNVRKAANDAVQSGLLILKSLETTNKTSLQKNLGRKIEAGIGVHVGKVATGRIHIGEEDHWIVMGYAVNIASRIQDITKQLNNNFIVSEEAFQLLNLPPASRMSNEITLKGVKEKFNLYLIGKAYSPQNIQLGCL